MQTSNGAGIAYDPASFNVPPTHITSGAGFDTLEWDNPPVSTLTWNSLVTGFQSGQFGTVDQGGTVSFTSTLGNGTVDIGQVDIAADQIISITPATQTLGPSYFGFPGASYTLTLRNPTAAALTYSISFAGITNAWLPAYPSTPFPGTVNVPAQGTVTLPLNLTPPLTLPSATYPFEVIANAPVGVYGAVGGTLIFNNGHPQPPDTPGPGPVSTFNTADLGLVVSPAIGNGGPGGTVLFQVQVNNVGTVVDTFNLYASGIPTVGFARYSYGNPAPTVSPGQTYTDTLAVQLSENASTGAFPVLIGAVGQHTSGLSHTQVMVNVVNTGVALSLSPQGGGLSPGQPTQLTITNTSAASDTFNLSVAGPAAQLITLPQTAVTLAAGANQVLNVTVGSPAFATLGTIAFSIAAQSASQPSSNASIDSSIQVQYFNGVTAHFQPASQMVPVSGPAVFPLSVSNVGSVQDEYSAQITGVTGAVTASLMASDGTAVQTIPGFQVPGQSLAQLNLTVMPTAPTGGVVTVTITSMNDPHGHRHFHRDAHHRSDSDSAAQPVRCNGPHDSGSSACHARRASQHRPEYSVPAAHIRMDPDLRAPGERHHHVIHRISFVGAGRIPARRRRCVRFQRERVERPGCRAGHRDPASCRSAASRGYECIPERPGEQLRVSRRHELVRSRRAAHHLRLDRDLRPQLKYRHNFRHQQFADTQALLHARRRGCLPSATCSE